jgi:tellurite resistance protein
MRRLTISVQACVETLALLVTMAWADGRLHESEKAGVLGAAGVLNLTKEMRDRLNDVLKKPLSVEEVLFDTLSARDRAFAYVAAAWMAAVDGDVDPKEQALLDKAATLLGYSAARKAELETIARDIEPSGEGGRKWAQELERLFRAIPARLEEADPDDVEVVFE